MCSQLGWLSSFKCQNCLRLRPHFLPAPISYQNSVKIHPNFPILQHRPYRHPVLQTLGWLGVGLVWYASIHMIHCKQGSQTRNLSAFAASLSRVFFTALTNAPLVFLWRLLSTWYIMIHQYQLYKQNSHSGSFRLIIREMKQQRVKTSAKYQTIDWDSSKIR